VRRVRISVAGAAQDHEENLLTEVAFQGSPGEDPNGEGCDARETDFVDLLFEIHRATALVLPVSEPLIFLVRALSGGRTLFHLPSAEVPRLLFERAVL